MKQRRSSRMSTCFEANSALEYRKSSKPTVSTRQHCRLQSKNSSRRKRMSTRTIEESLRFTQAMVNRELFIGRGAHTGRLYFATPKQYLGTHMHLVGASNFGKSFYLEHLLREFSDLGIPASIIDPHGDHAKHYYEFLLRSPRLRRGRKIVHFRPSSLGDGPCFNPFACGLADPAEVASLVLEAFMKVWGAMSFNETPRLERILRVMFHAFAANGLPLTESYQFLCVANRPYRQNLLAKVADERVR